MKTPLWGATRRDKTRLATIRYVALMPLFHASKRPGQVLVLEINLSDPAELIVMQQMHMGKKPR
jgi:hypothetical protein